MAVGVHRTCPDAVMNLRRHRRQGFPVPRHVDHWRPFRHDRHWRWPEFFELRRAVDDLAIHYRQHRLDPFDGFILDVEIVGRQRDQVRQLPGFDLAFLALFGRKPGAAMGEQLQRRVAAQALGIQLQAADGTAADQPVEGGPRVVTGHPRGIGAGADRNTFGKHARNGRRVLGRFGAVPVNEILALKRHAILDRNAAAEGFDPFDVLRGDGFGMVEEPRQTIEWYIAIDLLEDVEHAADGFVVSGVQAERPALFHQMPHHRFQFLFHGVRQVGTRFEEILEIRRREHQHLPGAVVS